MAREAKKDHNTALITWIIVDQQPFSIVGNKKFIEMINLLDIRYIVRRIPGKVSLTTDM